MAAITTNAAALQGTKLNTSSLADTQVLTYDGATSTWMNKAASGGGMTNPMTTAGDIIYGGASGAPTRLAKGADGQVLTLASGVPSWAAASGGGSVTPKYIFSTLFEDAANGSTSYQKRWTDSVAGSGTTSVSTSGLNLSPGSTAASYASRTLTLNSSTFTVFDGNVEFMHQRNNFVSGGNGYIDFMGIGNPTVATTGITLTDAHIGWFRGKTAGTLYSNYSCADGTTQTTGTFSAPGGGNSVYYINKTNAAIKYYQDGTLLGTLSAHIPTGNASPGFEFATSNSNTNTSNSVPVVGMMTYTKEMY